MDFKNNTVRLIVPADAFFSNQLTNEMKEIADDFSIRAQGLPAYLGSTAVTEVRSSQVLVSPETTVVSEFQTQLSDFLNVKSPMSLDDQLSVQCKFWGLLGYELPNLSEDQRGTLKAKVKANPTRRVMTAPLLDLKGRKAIMEKARNKSIFPKNQLKQNLIASGFLTPDADRLYGQLLAEPEASVKLDSQTYGMRYKTDSFEVVRRANYTGILEAKGVTVKGESNTPWTWSVMDVRVRSPRTNTTIRNLYSKVSPTATPEVHIAMQIMHHANGALNNKWEPDIVNENICELRKDGSVKGLVGVAAVGFNLSRRQVGLGAWNAGSQLDYFGVRDEESAF